MSKILIIDDEELFRDSLMELLEHQGYECRTASDGAAGVEEVLRFQPDVVLCDVVMPNMDGMEFLKSFREKGNETPVVMVTSIYDVETAVESLKNGAYDYINKPVNLGQLELIIENALEKGELAKEEREYRDSLEHEVEHKADELRNALRALDDAHMDTIYRLALAAEFKDNQTALHLRRISEYSELLAGSMGLAGEELETIKAASIMHDIGKIGIPDTVLLKPGELNRDEFDEIKKHPFMGSEILCGSDSKLLQTAQVIALSHHEKYDGSGYPRGLKGDSIPLAGRIIAVADVFDALTSERVYKSALLNEEAFRIMRDESGIHFDPQIIHMFFKQIDAIMEVRMN